MSDNFIDDD